MRYMFSEVVEALKSPKKRIVLLIILLNESFFYFVNPRKIDTHKVMLCLIFILFLVSIKYIDFKNSKYKTVIYFILLICIVEAFNSYISNGQPINIGLQASNIYYKYILYFFIVAFFKSNEDADFLKHCIIFIGMMAAIIYLIQAILFNKIIFLNMEFAEPRLGLVRFYTGYTIIIFSFFLSLSKALYKKNRKYSIISFIDFLSIFYVAQTRNFFIGLIIGIVVMLFTVKNKKKHIKTIAFILIVVFLIISFKDGDFYDLYKSTVSDISQSSGTVGFRKKEIGFYTSTLVKSISLGIGFYSLKFCNSFYIMGLNYRYYVSDIGIIGFAWQTGALGLLWVIFLFLSVLKSIKKLYRSCKEDVCGIIGIVTYVISTSFSTFYISVNESIIYIVIIMCILEIKCKNINTNKEKFL